MKKDAFWSWFRSHAQPLLSGRAETFEAMFRYLDRLPYAPMIVETGTTGEPDRWGGNGCSTILFDRYVSSFPAPCRVVSIDHDADAIARCSAVVSSNVEFVCEDGATALRLLKGPIDLLYLDGSHLYWDNPHPSAEVHLRELEVALPLLHSESLVVVDDAPIVNGAIGGKGMLVAKAMDRFGANQLFGGYQVGWISVVRNRERGKI
jgi:predicted O-methyltransferase YrrM